MTVIVIPFPAARQVGKVRKMADALIRKAGERTKGEGYWRQVVDHMADRMEAVGIDGDIIDRELDAFRNAVAIEMGRLRHCGHGGA